MMRGGFGAGSTAGGFEALYDQALGDVLHGPGKDSFDAIKIDRDGAIESYEAQPRAGESYALCCNINSDFAGADQP